jgi:hypothetical protein
VITTDSAVFEQEVQQMGHLLEIRRHIGIVSPKMDIVKREMNDPFDLVPRRMQLSGLLQLCSSIRGCG